MSTKRRLFIFVAAQFSLIAIAIGWSESKQISSPYSDTLYPSFGVNESYAAGLSCGGSKCSGLFYPQHCSVGGDGEECADNGFGGCFTNPCGGS